MRRPRDGLGRIVFNCVADPHIPLGRVPDGLHSLFGRIHQSPVRRMRTEIYSPQQYETIRDLLLRKMQTAGGARASRTVWIGSGGAGQHWPVSLDPISLRRVAIRDPYGQRRILESVDTIQNYPKGEFRIERSDGNGGLYGSGYKILQIWKG